MIEVKAEVKIKAPIQTVWNEITHHEGMIEWPDMHKVVISKKGKDHPDGLGCIRDVNAKGMYVQEEITHFETPYRMDYQVLKTDLPIIHHGGSMRLSEQNGETQVIWTSKLDMKSKNPIIKMIGSVMIKRKGNSGFAKALQYVKSKLEADQTI